ncbi:MAG: STAS domain-containing protein, partial [Flavobacterium sp.]
FGSTTTFTEKFTPHKDTPIITIDFKESRIVDMSALEAIKKIIDKYKDHNKQVILLNINTEGKRLMANSKLFEDNLLENS